VQRLGHIAFKTTVFDQALEFFTDVLGMKISDYYHDHSAKRAMTSAFLHCGLGERYTDHHTVAIVRSRDGRDGIHHSAFEVLDLDDLMCGQQHLKARGHVHEWGIGRHVEGSQIFDYWRDPFGMKVEHWTDGDLVNESHPVGSQQASPGALSQWGPPLPETFYEAF
jgi:catechol 2,3-dioxygenase-like lactoylglutathione lyase family enzyme